MLVAWKRQEDDKSMSLDPPFLIVERDPMFLRVQDFPQPNVLAPRALRGRGRGRKKRKARNFSSQLSSKSSERPERSLDG